MRESSNNQAARGSAMLHSKGSTMISPTAEKANMVVIHVCDESKKTSQDFKCEKNLLLKSMKYFEKYLSD